FSSTAPPPPDISTLSLHDALPISCAINEQRSFTDGRVLLGAGGLRRGKQKRADYILRYRPDYPIAIVEAKPHYKRADDGLQQAKDYAEILGVKFAYSSNGTEIVEFDFFTGAETSR